jgi:antitoxin VapB
MTEFNEKQRRLRALLAKRNLDGLLLRRVSSFAWATCGAASYINIAATEGVASLLVTPSSRYLITNNIEAPRFEQEEGVAEQGWVFRVGPWHELDEAVAELNRGLKLGADGTYPGTIDLSDEMARLRATLTHE